MEEKKRKEALIRLKEKADELSLAKEEEKRISFLPSTFCFLFSGAIFFPFALLSFFCGLFAYLSQIEEGLSRLWIGIIFSSLFFFGAIVFLILGIVKASQSKIRKGLLELETVKKEIAYLNEREAFLGKKNHHG